MKAIFAILLLAVGLTGCGTTQPKPPEERIVYRYIRVPVELTQKVPLAAPPDPVAYSTWSCDIREKTLMDLLQERTTEVGVANTRLDGVDAWSAKQAKIYEPAP
jgi:hypothetical protein